MRSTVYFIPPCARKGHLEIALFWCVLMRRVRRRQYISLITGSAASCRGGDGVDRQFRSVSAQRVAYVYRSGCGRSFHSHSTGTAHLAIWDWVAAAEYLKCLEAILIQHPCFFLNYTTIIVRFIIWIVLASCTYIYKSKCTYTIWICRFISSILN